eukprot:767532-Rhodomonas_salina.1
MRSAVARASSRSSAASSISDRKITDLWQSLCQLGSRGKAEAEVMGLAKCRWSGSEGVAPREFYGLGSLVLLNYPEVEPACSVGGVGLPVRVRGGCSLALLALLF